LDDPAKLPKIRSAQLNTWLLEQGARISNDRSDNRKLAQSYCQNAANCEQPAPPKSRINPRSIFAHTHNKTCVLVKQLQQHLSGLKQEDRTKGIKNERIDRFLRGLHHIEMEISKGTYNKGKGNAFIKKVENWIRDHPTSNSSEEFTSGPFS